MIYPQHLEQEVLKYCDLANIPVKDGVIPSMFVPEVQKFLSVKTKMDRFKTRQVEERNSLTITNLAKAYIKDAVESPIEEFLLTAMVTQGLDKHCTPQFEIGTKRVDFAFPAAKLVVECDGKEYHFSDADQIERDQKRDQYLAKKGWRVKHFDGLMIRRNINLCMDEIKGLISPFIKLT